MFEGGMELLLYLVSVAMALCLCNGAVGTFEEGAKAAEEDGAQAALIHELSVDTYGEFLETHEKVLIFYYSPW